MVALFSNKYRKLQFASIWISKCIHTYGQPSLSVVALSWPWTTMLKPALEKHHFTLKLSWHKDCWSDTFSHFYLKLLDEYGFWYAVIPQYNKGHYIPTPYPENEIGGVKLPICTYLHIAIIANIENSFFLYFFLCCNLLRIWPIFSFQALILVFEWNRNRIFA